MGASQPDIEVSYDVSNEFFRLWLDEGMIYTGALFAKEHETLEQAQINKLAWHADSARVRPGSRVLDIGCGWGGTLRYLTEVRGAAHGHGITLSPSQLDEIRRRELPGVTAELISYQAYRPDSLFDAAVSIGMFEHIASPEQATSGEAIAIYRDYFRRVRSYCAPGAYFSLQTVIRDRLPRNRDDLRELAWSTRTIFPGSLAPRLEDVVLSVGPSWEIMAVHTAREDYKRTCTHWLERLRGNAAVIRERFGDDVFDRYDRYLTACVRCFDQGYTSLCRFTLRRID